jgi:sugar/nucleoside kinase (ribokinase family)
MFSTDAPLPTQPLAASIGVVIAGHICLDIIPTIGAPPNQSRHLVAEGKLTHIGPATIATGGAVSNTGLTLHRLGIQTRLIGKIGDDLFGRAILAILSARDPSLATDMIIDPASPTSYTLVLSAPGFDRSFLHCAGANDTFCAADIEMSQVMDATIFHFGYPPILRHFYVDGGRELSELFGRVKANGVATSLDTAHVDVDAPAGLINWRAYLARVLPAVDFFMPSLDELCFMLEREQFQAMSAAMPNGPLAIQGGVALLRDLASTLLEMGVAVVAIKMGEEGIYLRTTANSARLQELGKLSLSPAWLNCELLAPAFEVEVVGTTGAGDCAVAGFLASLLQGGDPEDALLAATGAGACNVEVADAISGIPAWEELQARLQNKWPRREPKINLDGWQRNAVTGLWYSQALT